MTLMKLRLGFLCLTVLKFWSTSGGYLKLVSTIFYQIFIFHQIIDLQKLWKMFFYFIYQINLGKTANLNSSF